VPAHAAAYRPRRPTETVLYSLVREHLETFLAHARESYGSPLPRYVEDEFRDYLRCGVFAHGFVRAHCESCDHDLLVAFSCKRRGVCPSCAGRRMANEAAALVDRVLPQVPVRQWVLSLPFELRALAAFNAKVLSALSRIFAEAVGQWYRRAAKRAGIQGAGAGRTGAVTFVQRFGSSLNLNVHFHTCFLDGVYARGASGRLEFHNAPSPSREDLETVVRTVHRRALRWLARHGHLDRPPLEATSNEVELPSPIEACAAIATQRGTMGTLAQDPDSVEVTANVDAANPDGPFRASVAIEHSGFNLHANVRIAAEDDRGRERLCRYGARPPFSLERLRVLAGGRIAYRVKELGRRRAKHRFMTPLELLARLAALVPPPRYPLVRYHGVLAPHAAWRREIVPRPPSTPQIALSERAAESGKTDACRRDALRDTPRGEPSRREGDESPPDRTINSIESRAPRNSDSIGEPTRKRASGDIAHEAIEDEALLVGNTAPRAAAAVMNIAPNTLSVRHWSRLLGGLLYASSPRLRWPELLRRTFDVDVLECPKCQGRVRVVETIVDGTSARRILERMNLPVDPPRTARARDPTTLDDDDEHDAA